MQQGVGDGEVDYMSDDFVTNLDDVRPGLLSRRKDKRGSHSTKDVPMTKKVKIMEEEAREKGLSAPISSDNKGFSILQKMGYKEGTSLGKTGVN